MKVHTEAGVIKINYKDLFIELEHELATVFKPGKIMGEKLGAFYTKSMTITEFCAKIETYRS